MAWSDYYQKNKDRELRPLYQKALSYLQGNANSATEVGFGTGQEVLDLLVRGFSVLAIDQELHAAELLLSRCGHNPQLKVQTSKFEQVVDWPKVDLLFSHHGLPFCSQENFLWVFESCVKSVKSEGVFAIGLFGEKDSWVKEGKAVGITAQRVHELLKDFDILFFDDRVDQNATNLADTLHRIDIIARRR